MRQVANQNLLCPIKSLPFRNFTKIKVRIIHTFPDCSQLTFGKKMSADDLTIYLKRPNQRSVVPTLVDCLQQLDTLSQKYDSEELYEHFLQIYVLTTADIDNDIFDTIYAIAQGYGSDFLPVMILLGVFYAFMVSAENNIAAKAGKCRIRLAVHMLLAENVDAKFIAQYMRKAKKNDIINICESKGF